MQRQNNYLKVCISGLVCLLMICNQINTTEASALIHKLNGNSHSVTVNGNRIELKTKRRFNELQEQQHLPLQHFDHKSLLDDSVLSYVDKCILACGECFGDELNDQNIQNSEQESSLVCANYCLQMTDPNDMIELVLTEQLLDQTQFSKCFLKHFNPFEFNRI